MKNLKNFLKIYLILSLLLPKISNADPSLVKRGDVVKEDGMIFSLNEAQELRKAIIERDGLKELYKIQNINYNNLQINNNLTIKQLELSTKRTDELAEQLRSSQSRSDFEKLFLVGGGIVGTLGVLILSTKIVKQLQ